MAYVLCLPDTATAIRGHNFDAPLISGHSFDAALTQLLNLINLQHGGLQLLPLHASKLELKLAIGWIVNYEECLTEGLGARLFLELKFYSRPPSYRPTQLTPPPDHWCPDQ